MSNEEKILEMLSAMQSDMKDMQSEIKDIRSEIKDIRSEMKDMQSEMKDMHSKIDSVEEKLNSLTEAHEITRASVNTILDWTEKVSDAITFPLPKI